MQYGTDVSSFLGVEISRCRINQSQIVFESLKCFVAVRSLIVWKKKCVSGFKKKKKKKRFLLVP